jgi:orotate phosphoribosyltransferase-like protein
MKEAGRHLALWTIEQGVRPEVVIGSEGSSPLSTWVSYWLSEGEKTFSGRAVLSVNLERLEGRFAFHPTQMSLVSGKRALVVDDIAHTGKTLGEMIQLTRLIRGSVNGVAVLANRGVITRDHLEVPEFFSLFQTPYPSWDENNCELCRRGAPRAIRVRN